MSGTRTGASVSAALAVLWLVLALLNPETTYHLAPVLVAAGWPVVYRLRAGGRRPVMLRTLAVAGGAGTALLVTGVLGALGALRGPTLTGTGNALAETIIAIAAGVVAGMIAVGVVPQRRARKFPR
ncbi:MULTISPECIES: hypothetical protein [Arthrobacter]|uniref:Uncharacterized protein n=1 Tax=Arthrobacter oryzae TaxID=409290 RepID=A0A3N0BX05_9MICC|nr:MULTISPECIES: hypothetical protein [Arthrobacter]QYF89993.1 hypothetical protein KY499_00905 [Arthrobacter sp. PAMC25284]RNL53851.1 hypothetical protein D7003_12035 [Arthrobacter oryzae]